MKIISWNTNGIRAVERKGELEKFLKKNSPDILLIQETKAKKEQLKELELKYPDYIQFYNDAKKPGYAGTSIWVKKPIKGDFEDMEFITGLPNYEDNEGRVSRLDFGENVIFSVYFPNGGKAPEAWQGKLIFYEKFLEYVNDLRAKGKNVIFAGDVNCAHEEIDLARPKDNDGKIGFHPEERKRISDYEDNDWIDVFRNKYPSEIIYSWWSLRTKARDRNIGWRIDYFFIDKKICDRILDIKYLNDQMGSDHCPVLLIINY